MSRLLKRRLALGVAVLALGGGGAIAAVSATGQSSPGNPQAVHRGSGRMLTSAARYLGVSVSQLRVELRPGRTLAQVAGATPGESEAGLIEALVSVRRAKLAKAAAGAPERVRTEVNRPLTGSVRGRSRGEHGAARLYLGLTAAHLRNDLLAGKTLAQIADGTPGKSEAGLIEAIVAARTKRLEGAVKAGTITATRESSELSRLSARVTALVHRTHTKK